MLIVFGLNPRKAMKEESEDGKTIIADMNEQKVSIPSQSQTCNPSSFPRLSSVL